MIAVLLSASQSPAWAGPKLSFKTLSAALPFGMVWTEENLSVSMLFLLLSLLESVADV